MPDTLPEQLAIDSVIARIKRISKNNGYHTDIGLRVYDGWFHVVPAASTPAGEWAVVTELSAGPDENGGSSIEAGPGATIRPYEWVVQCLLEGFIVETATVDSDADADHLRLRSYQVRSDFRRALLDPLGPDLTGADRLKVLTSFLDEREAGTRTTVVAYQLSLHIPECEGRLIGGLT